MELLLYDFREPINKKCIYIVARLKGLSVGKIIDYNLGAHFYFSFGKHLIIIVAFKLWCILFPRVFVLVRIQLLWLESKQLRLAFLSLTFVSTDDVELSRISDVL